MTKKILIVSEAASIGHIFGVCAAVIAATDVMDAGFGISFPDMVEELTNYRSAPPVARPRDIYSPYQAVQVRAFQGNYPRSHLRRG